MRTGACATVSEPSWQLTQAYVAEWGNGHLMKFIDWGSIVSGCQIPESATTDIQKVHTSRRQAG